MPAAMGRIDLLPQAKRRVLVAVGLAAYPLAVALLVALKHTSLNRFAILGVIAAVMLTAVAVVFAGYRYARGRIDGRRSRLDERDLSLRQQAYAASHRTLAVILIAAAAVVELYVTSGRTLRLDAASVLPALMWVAVYIPALPSLMLAWTETDQPADA